MILETKRLRLRSWCEADLQPMFAMNQDPNVMAYFPALESLAQTQQFIVNANQCFKDKGYMLYATELKATHDCIGFIGLSPVDFPAHFTPAVEIAWRLSYPYWGQGLATEGAKAVLAHAFSVLAIPEVVSFTVKDNVKSIRVMQKIGLQHDANGDFNHPSLPDNSPLRQHVLYRITKS